MTDPAVDVLVTTVARLSLEPGDVVCIRLASATPDVADLVRRAAKKVFPDHRVLLLGPGSDLFIVEETPVPQPVDSDVEKPSGE